MKPDRVKVIEAIFEEVCAKYGITSKNDKAAFLAQMAHESGEFTIKQERMNYTTPQRIVDVWPSRFNMSGTDGKLNAHDYTNNPQKLANTVYANKNGNGDFNSGDGYRYRGGGFMQITFKINYQKFADHKKIPVDITADTVHISDLTAMESAAWFYVIEKNLLGETDIVKITKVVNGGSHGLAERRKYYNRALEAII